MTTYARPIWDNSPLLQADIADEYVDYRIQCDGETIFNGRAYKRPDTGRVEISINSICAPYLRVPFPETASPEEACGFAPGPAMKRTFRFLREGGSDTQDLDFDVEFYADWGYNPSRNPRPAIASDPVTGEVSPRQVVLTSFYDPTGPIPVYMDRLAARAPGDENYFFNIPATAGQAGVAWIGMGSGYAGAAQITVGSAKTTGVVTYRVVDDCRRYALYYLNAYGGWDSLLVHGSPKEANEYTRTTYKKAYALSQEMGAYIPRGTVNFLNSYTKSFTCTTGWLSDEQAARMDHLFGSVDVYLCDLYEDRFMPVVLTDKTFEYKTFRNQGGHLVNYTIQMQAAVEFTRR